MKRADWEGELRPERGKGLEIDLIYVSRTFFLTVRKTTFSNGFYWKIVSKGWRSHFLTVLQEIIRKCERQPLLTVFSVETIRKVSAIYFPNGCLCKTVRKSPAIFLYFFSTFFLTFLNDFLKKSLQNSSKNFQNATALIF
jgi:hypothetical protein